MNPGDSRLVGAIHALSQRAASTSLAHDFDLSDHVAQLLLIADEVDEALAHIAQSEIDPEEQLAMPIYHLREMTRSLRHSRKTSKRTAGLASIADDEAITEELADIVIRVLSYSGGNGLALGQAILRKMAINETRELRHGKQF